MKKKVKLIAGAAVFGLVAGTVFQGVEYAGNQIWGTQIEDSGTASAPEISSTNLVSGTGD